MSHPEDPIADSASAKTILFVAEEHGPLYDLWQEGGCRNLSVCHVDFHCDMRGLLIDRRHGRARFVWQSDPFMNRIDSGSFLAHAVMNGFVTNLRWVHDEFVGRSHDRLYCVKYESDLSALPFRILGGKNWVPLNFVEQTFAKWEGPRPGEYLSLDWDGLAFSAYQEDRIRELMSEILDREFTPAGVFVAHSIEYCHPERALFDEFITRLEKKFATQAVRLPDKSYPQGAPSLSWQRYHQIEHFVLRGMRKRNIW